MKTYTNESGTKRYIDFKNSIETTDLLKRTIIIRWWITTFEKNWNSWGEGCYSIHKYHTISNRTYCMNIDMNNNMFMFDCYYHNQKKIIEEERKEHFFFEVDVKDYSLDEVYELYKQGLKQWENHSKNFVIS